MEENKFFDEMDENAEEIEKEFERVDEEIEAGFERVDREIDEGFDRVDEALEGGRLSGKDIEEKIAKVGTELGRAARKVEEAFEEAFEVDGDNHGDKPLEPVDIQRKAVDKRRAKSSQAVFWGLALIAVGVVVILQQMGFIGAGFKWWAIFILVPGFASLSGALSMFIRRRRVSGAVRSMLGSGVIITTVGFLFLLNLSWGVYWPLMLVVFGFSIFLNAFTDRHAHKSVVSRWFDQFGWWVGLCVMGLGVAFQGQNLNLFSVQDWMGVGPGWWGAFLMLPAAGGLIHALIIILRTKRFPFPAILLSVAGIASLTVGLVALLGQNWNLITPVIIVGAGLSIILGELLSQVIGKKKSSRQE
jgi:hypothetical protein